MRGGITCVKCNTSKSSLKFFQPMNDKYRCSSCGFKGMILAGADKRLYLVADKNELPKVQLVETKSKPIQKTNTVIKTDQKRNQTINRIIHLVDILNIKEYSGWEDIDFKNITNLRYQNDYLTDELVILLEGLERIHDKRLAAPVKMNILLTEDSSNHNWRMNIPKAIKNSFNDWNKKSIEMIELYAKDVLRSARGKEKKEIEAFLELIRDIPNKKKISEKENDQNIEKWRTEAPKRVKDSISSWKTISMKEMHEVVSDLISTAKGMTVRLELEDYLSDLEDYMYENENEEEISFDPLAVIEKYKYGAINEKEKSVPVEIDDSWRRLIPGSVKTQLEDWRTAPMQSVYDQAKELMGQNSGTSRQQLMEFVVELSQILFDSAEEEEEEIHIEEESISRDDARDAVMSLVEMIILPHLEVMDIIQKKGGNITFSNLWYKPFTDQLKEEVKDRDEWKCVICESDTDLHVHHKIPREKGGIHHKDNLVTLCASCHAAVETADVQHAFKKCLANFHRNKYSNINRENLSLDKKLLKEEVESKLDSLLNELNKRDEQRLMEEVVGIMKRLEIIFYD